MSKAASHPKTASPSSASNARQRANQAITEILKVCDTLETFSEAEADLEQPMPRPSLEMLASLLRRISEDLASAIAEIDQPHNGPRQAPVLPNGADSQIVERRSRLEQDHARIMHALNTWIEILERLSMRPAYSEINPRAFDPVLAEMKILQVELDGKGIPTPLT